MFNVPDAGGEYQGINRIFCNVNQEVKELGQYLFYVLIEYFVM